MNITMFIGGLSGGGAERVVCNLANYLQKCGEQVSILTMTEDTPSYHLESDVKTHFLLGNKEKSSFIINTIKRIFRLVKYLKTSKTDLYVVMLPETTLLLLSLKWLTKSKIIFSERNDPKQYSKIKRFLLKRLSILSDGCVFQTQDALSFYSDFIKKVKKTIIPNAINDEFIGYDDCGDVPVENSIIALGRLNPQKNFPMLINAFSNISNKYKEYNLYIYGEGSKRDELEEQICKLGLQKRVFLPGYVNEIKDYIMKSTVFVLSSDYEGIPNALIEAMALGKPCIATDCSGGGPRSLIDDKINGILIPKNDVMAMSDALDYVLSNKNRAMQMGENAKTIKRKLNPNIIYSQWRQFINEVFKGEID